jgi:predicted metal-binding membrane protein
MAHNVETMSSQIVPLSNKTTINNNETASATMINIIHAIHIIILTVGCCWASMLIVVVVLVAQDYT